TTLGECTITVIAGTHYIEAYATVDGSYTKFGEFIVTVETGDEVTLDIEAPQVDITQPGGSEHICGSSVEVVGTATDISGVASITVNGAPVDFFSTGNPDDENEVSFSTTVGDLVVNEWNIITIVITDTLGNSIAVDRQVYRDPCNLPPEITSISGPMDPVSVENSVDMFATFTDPDIDDTHTAEWDWGDGSTSAGTVDQTERTVTGSHHYEQPGVYTVTLTVTDSFGESDTAVWSQYVVIYDPSAGFVTGGGWIDSPPGACPSDPELTGKASFGFVSKYKKGTDVPMGTTEFQFRAGDINFHSDSYDWLLITGAKAMFKGTGTINGEGSYKFMVMAVDGALSNDGTPDTFRIRIWTENEETGEELVFYDNGPEGTVLGGGSITIHN
ncbi:MAG: PKD domain-containing protein, partial [Candidatus Thorarchaeota archaeon]